MKRILLLTISVVLILTTIVPVSANDTISVKIDGADIQFDVPPAIINNRTMVPFRKIFEALGADVYWNGTDKKVIAIKGDINIEMQIRNNIMRRNGVAYALDSSPIVVDGRTLIPVRAVAEAFNCDVKWVSDTKTIIINTDNVSKYATKIKSKETKINYSKKNSGIERELIIECTKLVKGKEAYDILKEDNKKQLSTSIGVYFLEFNIQYISSSAGADDRMAVSEIINAGSICKDDKSFLNINSVLSLNKNQQNFNAATVSLLPGQSSKVLFGFETMEGHQNGKTYEGELFLKIPAAKGEPTTWLHCDSSTLTINSMDFSISDKARNSVHDIVYSFKKPISKRNIELSCLGLYFDVEAETMREDYFSDIVKKCNVIAEFYLKYVSSSIGDIDLMVLNEIMPSRQSYKYLYQKADGSLETANNIKMFPGDEMKFYIVGVNKEDEPKEMIFSINDALKNKKTIFDCATNSIRIEDI